MSMPTPALLPEPFTLQAADGCTIKGFFWRHAGGRRRHKARGDHQSRHIGPLPLLFPFRRLSLRTWV